MRLFMMMAALTMMALPAAAQTQKLPLQAALQTWDQCVGDSAQDYVDMFGAVSMDSDKLDKAVEDCWDEEFKFQEAVKQNPELSDGVINELVTNRKAEIKAKWYDYYVTNKNSRVSAR